MRALKTGDVDITNVYIVYLLVFAGLLGKRIVAIVALVEMPFDALLMVPGSRRRRGHRTPRSVAPMGGLGGGGGRGRRLIRCDGIRMMGRTAPAGHDHAPQVDGGRVAVAQVIVGPRVRIRDGSGGGDGPQVMVVVVVVSHFDGRT